MDEVNCYVSKITKIGFSNLCTKLLCASIMYAACFVIFINICNISCALPRQLKPVCFSPSTCCENNIVYLTKKAKKKIYIAIYAITNPVIVDALVQAKDRGINIKIVVDNVQSRGKSSLVPFLIKNGFNIRVKRKFNIEHNKFAIFDDDMAITGSYNWTVNATSKNSENCLLISRKSIIKQYSQRFSELWEIYSPTK